MRDETPVSNAELVALNIVDHALVDELNHPGKALADLFLKMAAMARDIGGDYSAATTDWHESIAKLGDEGMPAISGLIDRQALAIGETWSKKWMLAVLAKHVYEGLERNCLSSNAAGATAQIEYDEDGSVRSWRARK